VELTLPGLRGLRRDVDTVDDLREAARIGLGPHTAAATAAAQVSLA
jgi:2-phospho-L-lactate guanylyltransferase